MISPTHNPSNRLSFRIDSRNPNLAAVKKPLRGCLKVAAMAARMGFTERRVRWVQRSAALQPNGKRLHQLRKVVDEMWASGADVLGKDQRYFAQTNTQTNSIGHHSIYVYAIQCDVCDATVYCANTACVRHSIGRKFNDGYTWTVGYIGQRGPIADGENVWQTKNISVFDGWGDCLLLWIE